MDLLKAPWADQVVSPSVRVLAWIITACALFALSAAAYFTVLEGPPKEYIWQTIGMLSGAIYLTAVFIRVAISGRAPTGWLPWK
jgi:hypothetical protein